MKSAVSLCVLSLILIATIVSVRGGSDCSCPSGTQKCEIRQCPIVEPTVNLTIQQYAHSSPLFFEIIPREGAEQVDSVCNTFLKIDDHTYYLAEYTILKNGSVVQGQFIVNDVPNSPGRFRFSGTRGPRHLLGKLTVITELPPPCPKMHALQFCLQNQQGNEPWNHTTLSTTRGLPWPGQKCLSEFQSQVAALGYDTTTPDYLHPPQKYSPKCITLLNGARTINAHLLHPDFHLASPE